MPSLTSCLQQAGSFIGAEAKAAIGKLAADARAQGMETQEASKMAVSRYLQESGGRLDEVEQAIKSGTVLYEPEKPIHQGAMAEQEAAGSRVDQVIREMPGLMVKLDPDSPPTSAMDFMAAVKAEADEMTADAPLMQMAAECFLLNGL